MSVLKGRALADKMYKEWEEAKQEIPASFLQMLPEDWRHAQPLDPELADCLYHTDFMGPVLKHPLVFGIPYSVFQNPRYNYGLQWKKDCLEKYARERDYSGFIYAHERPYRLDAVQHIIADLPVNAHEVWNCARIAWTDSENIYQNEYEWRTIFEDWMDDCRESFMTADDVIEWAMLPDSEPIPVYRGFCVDGREQGMSWTTDKIRAKFFAKRFAERGIQGAARLAVGKVMKSDCIGYLNERNESEVVVLPENVEIIRIGELPVKEEK
jgi:hypothetical protein